MLRSIFTQTSDQKMPFVQHVLRADSVDIVHETLRLQSGTNSKHAMMGKFLSRTKTSSGRQSGFKNRFSISVDYERLTTEAWKIGVQIHHALYDGVSLPLLLSDLESLILDSSSLLNPQDASTFLKFATTSLSRANEVSARDFWTKYLSSSQTAAVNRVARKGDAHLKRISHYQPQFIPSAAQMLQYAKSHGITSSALFLAVTARILSAMVTPASNAQAKSTTVVIGVYIANRGHLRGDMDRYPAVNLLPVVVDTALPLPKAAARIQRDLIEISEPANVSASLWQILEWTDTQVSTFVNWLQLPDAIDNADGEASDRFRIQGALDEVIEDAATDFVLPTTFTQEQRATAYPVSKFSSLRFWKTIANT
jgi:hypothetical protein